MPELLNQDQLTIILQLLLALVLGGLVGLEREYKRKSAGLKTFALVSLGSALFTIIGLQLFGALSQNENIRFDPSKIIEAVAVGLGFIGAGIIIYRHEHVEGLSTAAGVWVAGAIGVAAGAGLYLIAVFSALLSLLVMILFSRVEHEVFGKSH